MNMIVAVDNHWGIGRRNALLVRIPYDQKHFREETLGKVVVLGRKTLETFPQKQPLPERTNIVLSANPEYRVRNAKVMHSVEALLAGLSGYRDEDIYIVGGESVYRQMLPYCGTVHVTKIDHIYEADSYFPDLDKEEGFQITGESDELTYFDIAYRFLRYERCLQPSGSL